MLTNWSKLLVAAALALTCASGVAADEYRAFWVTGWTSGFRSQAEVEKLLGKVGDPNSKGDIRNANCNAVFVQVRRRFDVCYPSGMGEPYFSELNPSDFNALQAMIDAAHDTTGGKQRIEVHCWIVTFATSTATTAPSPVYYQHNNPADPDNYWVTLNNANPGVETNDHALDPGHPKCEEYLANVCMDLVQNFDIDGIHYDYIRFTANNQGYNPTSIARYNARYGATGKPAYDDTRFSQWRRDQVTALVRKVYAKIQAVKPWVKQSGSFVTWDQPPTASTREAFYNTRPYYDVYSDWDSWMQEGIVDMAVPMDYYDSGTTNGPAHYQEWMNFIKDRKFNRMAIIGPGIYKNSLSNAILQLQQTRDESPNGNYADGFSGYSYQDPYSNGTWANFAPTFTSQVCPTPANIPDMPWKTNPTKGHISGTVTYTNTGLWADGATVTVSGPAARSMVCDGTGFYAFIDLPPGSYTLTATQNGYTGAQRVVSVAIGQVTGNMYVNDLSLGGSGLTVISNIQAIGVTDSVATITWTTDQASSSRVEYGTTSSYGFSTPINNIQVMSHSVQLVGLNPNKTYHFRVISQNSSGTSMSGDYTFTTYGPPAVYGIQTTNINSTSATITWQTDLVADGKVNYGTTASYGGQATAPSTGTSHSVTLTGLMPNTDYHYQCLSANPYGLAVSTDFTFRTAVDSADIIVDNTDAGWSNTSPNGNAWLVGTRTDVPKIGTSYLYNSGDGSLTQDPTKTRKCRWTPNLPTAGYYDVYAYYQKGINRNTAAPYTVYYNGGSVRSVQNQYSDVANVGDWFLIGQNLPFAAGNAGYVELTTLSTNTSFVSADAAKWVLRSVMDLTPPGISNVTDELYTTSQTELKVSWSGSDPESGIKRYEYAIGTASASTNVRSWTNVGTAAASTIGGLSLSVGQTYYISIRGVNGMDMVSDPVSSGGVTVARAAAGIAQAKGFADGEPVALPAATVTAKFGDKFYIEDSNRSSGIRVDSSVSVMPNHLVQVYGVIRLIEGYERAITNCKVVIGGTGAAIKPLLTVADAIGGGGFGIYTPGIYNGFGLNDNGLLVRVVGKVWAVVADGFYLDDGSGITDDSGNSGIKVWTGIANSAVQNTTVGVTGIASCRKGSDGNIYPQVLLRESNTL